MGESMDMLIGRHCKKEKKSSSGKVDIRTINNLPLKVLFHTITRVVGAQAPPEATKTQLQTAIDCMAPTIFNWSEAVLANMKKQLTKFKNG